MLLSKGCLHCLPLREGLLSSFEPTEASVVPKGTEEPLPGQTLPWLSSSALLQCLGSMLGLGFAELGL